MGWAGDGAEEAARDMGGPGWKAETLQRTILGVALGMASVLTGASAVTCRRALDLSWIVDAGQAENEMFGAFRRRCPPHVDITGCIAPFLRDEEPEGLRFVSVTPPPPGGDGVASAGVRLSPPGIEDDLRMRGRPFPVVGGERHAYIMPPSPPPAGLPTILLEYVPTRFQALRRQAWMTFAAGLAGAVAIVAGALFLQRLVRQRDVLLREAQEKEKLAALGRMSAVLAHELRNPLASAKGRAELVVELLGRDDRLAARARSVVDELARVEAVTRQLLDFVRSGKVQRSACDVARLAHDAVERAGGEVELRLEPGVPSWQLDAYAMERALLNLLRNALEAQAGAAEKVALIVGVRGGELYFCVRDHGPGFPSGVELGAPFATTRSGGTGLGLAVSQQIVKAHGGRMVLGAAAEGGAEVEIFIP